jgi:hypothetical protein
MKGVVMKRNDLTRTARRRFDANHTCPKCNESIKDTENILFTVKRERRFKVYKFYHERCLINGEKEKTE